MLTEKSRTIFDNPKASMPLAMPLSGEIGRWTSAWQERLRRRCRSFMPADLGPGEVLWLARAEDLEDLWTRMEAADPGLGQVRYVCLLDVFADVYDVVALLTGLRRSLPRRTRLLVVNYNWLWAPCLAVAARLGLTRRRSWGNTYRTADVRDFLRVSGWRPVMTVPTYQLPVEVPLLSPLVDRLLGRLPLLRRLTLATLTVARPVASFADVAPSVSVIVPCRNEEDNVEAALRRTPPMGPRDELVFVDDQSTDRTAEILRRCIAENPDRAIRLVSGPGRGKAEAVRAGVAAARNEVCMILDADLTVIPEDLPQFYEALRLGVADFLHGTRFVYPQERGAMRFANIAGNVFFSILFSFILDQRTTDTLCGTKVFWREDWPIFEEMRDRLSQTDLWGDYNLIFGAARFGLDIAQLPVHYYERLEGATKMNRRLANGLRMLRVAWRALWEIKFAP